jgi:hypothetical protein
MAESLNMKRWSIGVMEYWEPIAPIQSGNRETCHDIRYRKNEDRCAG